MTLVESLRTCLLERFATSKGRASRSEYWWFQLALLVVTTAWPSPFGGFGDLASGELPEVSMPGLILSLVALLALLVPATSVTVRRLHDIDRAGTWMLLGLVPLVGMIVLLVFTCRRGTSGPNRFGPDPLAPAPT
jgi:uncharacterized membrane protein YhaH (DUF805 family)